MITVLRPRLATALVGFSAILVAACGAGGGGTPGPQPTATPAPTATGTPVATPTPTSVPPTASPAPVPATAQASAYFIRDGRVAPTHRSVNAAAPARDAVLALIAGPSAVESAAGLSSDVPSSTRLLGVSISASVATVDLSREFTGGTTASQARRVAQVVCTLTHFATIRSVTFHIEGAPLSSLGGVALSRPVTRAAVESWLPAILVESPASGDSVRSPLRVDGSADTFEAVFRLRLVTADGHMLFDIPVKATSGTGTRGTFDVTVWFTAGGPATLRAYEISMRDGRMINVSETPVRLLQ